MPPRINVAVGSGAIVVATLLAVAAVAVYESPEVRQFAEDCRRRIAVALHSLGDEINPASRNASSQPRYNRPEDAEGFLRSRAEADVDADEDSRRRQREELIYWNQIRLEKLAKDEEKLREGEKEAPVDTSKLAYESLHQESIAEKDTYVYNTGTDIQGDIAQGFVRRRDGLRGFERGIDLPNPFADDQMEVMEEGIADANLMQPDPSEMSDIYGADDLKPEFTAHQGQLVDVSDQRVTENAIPNTMSPFAESLYTSGAEAHPDSAFASIHAWANDNSNASFHASFPVSPTAPASEASKSEEDSGELTPTDFVSLAGSGEDIGIDNTSSIEADVRSFYAISEDGDGISTPGSWTEVGSVTSGTQ